jgi:CDP-diacylglycerol--glycerol-3-phosphate 3-phosphatidyltransferase
MAGLRRIKVSANQLTVSAIVLSACMGIALWHVQDYSWVLLLIPVGLLIRMALNALDGMMARTYNMQSKKGEILNEFGDVVSDVIIYIPLIKLNADYAFVIWIFVILGILNEFAGILGKAINGARRYDGPMGKSDRAFFTGFFCLLCFFWQKQLSANIGYVYSIAILLLIVSTYNRLSKSLN